MKRILSILLAGMFALALSNCGVPPRQPPPDYEKVHQDHEKAQEDLRDEEDKRNEED